MQGAGCAWGCAKALLCKVQCKVLGTMQRPCCAKSCASVRHHAKALLCKVQVLCKVPCKGVAVQGAVQSARCYAKPWLCKELALCKSPAMQDVVQGARVVQGALQSTGCCARSWGDARSRATCKMQCKGLAVQGAVQSASLHAKALLCKMLGEVSGACKVFCKVPEPCKGLQLCKVLCKLPCKVQALVQGLCCTRDCVRCQSCARCSAKR